jgi:hypothetical protein
MTKPYVVSADIQMLLKNWAAERGFTVPHGDFFEDLREEFRRYVRRIFPALEFISEEEIARGLMEMVNNSGLVPVSLDRVYLEAPFYLDVTRLVNEKGEDCGLGHRPGSPNFLQQIRVLRETGLTEVLLVDDMIHTGGLLERIVRCLSQIGIRVPLVCAGIGVGAGITRGNRLTEIRCVRRYEKVIDDVCERDFYPGVPLSGKPLKGGDNVGMPYLLPFGNPGSWASIPPEWQVRFSSFCLQQTTRLFEKIEECSNQMVTCAEVGRAVVGLPTGKTRFADALGESVETFNSSQPS